MDKLTSQLQVILETEERNAVWLSKKLGCSHTLCYNWLKGKAPITDFYRLKIKGLFGEKYGI